MVDLAKEFKKIVKKYITSGLDEIYDRLKDIYRNISDSVFDGLSSVESVLTNLGNTITENIGLDLKGLGELITTEFNIFDNFLQFDGIIQPLVSAFGQGFEAILPIFAKQFLSKISVVNEKVDESDTLGLERKSIMDFETAMTNINNNCAWMFGIRPFNIILGNDDWIARDKKGPYYDIMRSLSFMVILFFIALVGVNQFFGYMFSQRIKEHYQYEKHGIMDYVRLEKRDIIDSDKLKELNKHLGYNDESLEHSKKLFEFYPSVRDLIDFAVREAFEPRETLFIFDENIIPKAFIEYSEKIGLPIEWIEKFWHSHWRLLGAGQILEAFHRKLINETDLKYYLKRLDYTEKDRQLIMDMSYNLLTRVDVRRIYANGLMTTSELLDYYSTLGFSDKDKILMTNLAKQVRFIEAKDLRSLFIKQYEAGLLNDSEIIEKLRMTGLDTDEIKLFLAYSDEVNELEFKLKIKEQIESKFYDGDINFDELITQLRGIGTSNREIKRVERNAQLYDFTKKKLPSITELNRYLKKEFITLMDYVYYALRLGYSEKHIFWILKDKDLIK